MKRNLLKLLFSITSVIMTITSVPLSPADAQELQTEYQTCIAVITADKSNTITMAGVREEGGYYLSNGCAVSFSEAEKYYVDKTSLYVGSAVRLYYDNTEPSKPGKTGKFIWGENGKIEYAGTAAECGLSKILTVTEISGVDITMTDGKTSYTWREPSPAYHPGYSYHIDSDKLKTGDRVECVMQNEEVIALIADKNPLRFNIEPDELPLIIEKGSTRTGIDIYGQIGEHRHDYLEAFGTLNGWMIHESPYQFVFEDPSVANVPFKQACTFSIHGASVGSTLLTVTAPDGKKASMTIIVTDTGKDSPTGHKDSPTENTVNNNVRTSGDINGDGRITVADLVYLQKIINKDNVYSKSADMNNDGTVDVFDMILLKREILGV